MSSQQPRYSAEETAQRGDEIYEREVRARVEAGNHGKVVAIDIETGAYALEESAPPPQSASALGARMPRSGSCGSATARCTGSEEAMINGKVNSNREATIRLSVRGQDDREQEIEAVIDTGFNG